MEKEQLYEKIEAYLAGQLPDADRTAFEREMAADAELAKEVALHRSVADFVKDKALRDFRQTVAEVDQAFTTAPSPRRTKWWLGLGAVAILAIIGWMIWISRTPATNLIPETPTATMPATPPTNTDTTSADTVRTDTVRTAPPTKPIPQADRKTFFLPNADLEAEIAMQRDAYYKIEAAACRLSGPAVRFDGTLLTALSLPTLELVILNNKSQEMARLPVTATPVEAEENIQAYAAKKRYVLAAEKSVQLPTGRYYARLQGEGLASSLWMAAFEKR